MNKKPTQWIKVSGDLEKLGAKVQFLENYTVIGTL